MTDFDFNGPEWAKVVAFADNLKAEHFSSHDTPAAGCDWCIAATLEAERVAGEYADRCMHRQQVDSRWNGRQDLFCKRAPGHEGNHLHDQHPGGATFSRERGWVYGGAR